MNTQPTLARYIVELIGWQAIEEGLYESSTSYRYEIAAPSAEQAVASIRAFMNSTGQSKFECKRDLEDFDIRVVRISSPQVQQ